MDIERYTSQFSSLFKNFLIRQPGLFLFRIEAYLSYAVLFELSRYFFNKFRGRFFEKIIVVRYFLGGFQKTKLA